MRKILLLSSALSMLLSGCALAISDSRAAYILARDHGWIELTFIDSGIAPRAVDPENAEMPATAEPPYCELQVKIERESFLQEVIYPEGTQPPYSVDSGFRFPIPAGQQNLYLSYSGCHRHADQPDAEIMAFIQLNVQQDTVTKLLYSAGQLRLESVEPDRGATLKEIDAKLDALLESGRSRSDRP